jgi:aldehyde dehydrogenase (NAD+)
VENDLPYINETQDLFIGGKRVSASDDEYLTTRNPATCEPITTVAAGTADDIDTAVTEARKALPEWRDMLSEERGRLLYQVSQLIRENQQRLAEIESLDQGKPVSQAEGDMNGAARYFEYYAGIADKLEGTSIPIGTEQIDFTIREPYGVSAHILPWNFPGNLFARGVAPALAAGNTVVAKPAEQTPLSTLKLADLCAEAGIPNGVINVVTGYGDPAGRALSSHPGVDTITFTGSVPTGQAIMKQAAENIVDTTLELGGKNPALVFPDADLAQAAKWITMAIFDNAGQICSAVDRVIVHKDVHDELVERIITRAESYKIGSGEENLDMGPLVSEEQFERVLAYIQTGKKAGATLATGGRALDRVGYFIEPTVFTDVESDMQIAQEEIFGPVLAILEFSDKQEGIDLANDVEYGLVSGVFTSDVTCAHQVARQLEAGNVYVNRWFGGTVQAPFGGFKMSGIGREKGQEALASYLQTKTIALNINDRDDSGHPAG